MTPRQTISRLLILGAIVSAAVLYQRKQSKQQPSALSWPDLGEIVHTHNGVPIYSNGLQVFKSHGKHYAEDGYYYGRKWQCVEFIKRYYHTAHEHRMPNVWGHAKEFFNPQLNHGQLNSDRGMIQFKNGAGEKPQVDDLLIWSKEPYGHVAIISAVHDDHILVAQQNIYGAAQQSFKLENSTKITGASPPAGWLRLPQ